MPYTMYPPGSNLPPQIFAITPSCSVTGIGLLTFKINKIITDCELNATVVRDVDQQVVWTGMIPTTVDERTFRLSGLNNGDYTINAVTNEGDAHKAAVIACSPTSTSCDLAIGSPISTPALASTNRGQFSFVATSSFQPMRLELTFVNSPSAPTILTTTNGRQYLTSLEPGNYTIIVQDAAGCSQTLAFSIAAAPVYGCMDLLALNYNPLATQSDNSCRYAPLVVSGCTNPRARNYNPLATTDNGTCAFGPIEPLLFDYNFPTSTTVVYSEPENKWATEQTSKPQMLLPIDGRHIHAVPLPGESNEPEGRVSLWEHNVGAVYHGQNVPAGVLLYGKRHKTWVEIIILGAGSHTIKNLDNLVLVSNDSLPERLIVNAPEQGTFTQVLKYDKNHLTTCERDEQLTYVQLIAPEAAPWGGRIRAQYIRLRIEFQGVKPLRLSRLFALLRESVT